MKKRVISAVLVVVALALALAACTGGASGGGAVAIKQIHNEVRDNEAAAKEKYQDNLFSMSGVVTKVSSWGQNYTIDIGEEKSSIWTATCADIPSEDALSLKAGDKITVTGKCSVVDQYAGLIMVDCYIGTTPPDSAKDSK
jgi:hypothetical protein